MRRLALFALLLLAPSICVGWSWTSLISDKFSREPTATKDHLRYYVVDFTGLPWDVHNRVTNIDDALLTRLQCMGPLQDPDLELYDSNYNLVDQWFLVQLLNSPLRVHDPKHADAIFVPTRYSFQNHEAYKQLMANLTTYLPLLGQKPHFVILGAPRQSHVNENDPLVTDPVAQQHLLYMSMVVPDFLNGDVRELPNFITVPYYHQVHWTQETMQTHRPFNASTVLASKHHWAAHAYSPRPIYHKASEAAVYGRVHLYQQCVTEEDTCTFLHPQNADWPAVFRASMGSLFTAQPRGDWVSRCSISDVIAAGSIPLVPLEDFGPYMPFTDVLDWKAYTEVLTEDEAAAPHCTCTEWLEDGGELVLRLKDFGEASLFESVQDRNVTCACEGQTHVRMLQERYSGSKAAVLPKLQAVWRVRQVFQYSLDPDWFGVRWDATHTLAHGDDALTFSLKALMRRMCTLGLVDKCQHGQASPEVSFAWMSARRGTARQGTTHKHHRRNWT